MIERENKCISFLGEERVTGNTFARHITSSVTPTFGIRDNPFLSEEKVVSLHREFEASENSLSSAEKFISLGRKMKSAIRWVTLN